MLMIRHESEKYRRVEAAIHDAAFDPAHWDRALRLLSQATHSAGAALIVRDRQTKIVRQANIIGVAAGMVEIYVDYYAKIDRYANVLDRSPINQPVRLSEAIAHADLRGDEWYNDYLLKRGMGDVLGSRLHESKNLMISTGIQEGVGQPRLAPEHAARFSRLLKPLRQAVRLQQQLYDHGWRSSIALRSLDQLSAGVIVADGERKVIEMNAVAERILRQNDGLSLRQGRFQARRNFETTKLAGLLSEVIKAADDGLIRRMPIGRCDNQSPYLLTITSLSPELVGYGRTVALTVIIDPDMERLTQEHLAELFGLSPAEGRLAIALMSGKLLRNIATDQGVEVATLRTQLRAVFEKVGVRRQIDLIRILTRIPVGR